MTFVQDYKNTKEYLIYLANRDIDLLRDRMRMPRWAFYDGEYSILTMRVLQLKSNIARFKQELKNDMLKYLEVMESA